MDVNFKGIAVLMEVISSDFDKELMPFQLILKKQAMEMIFNFQYKVYTKNSIAIKYAD
mgnify:CR=1 FL=1